VILHDTSFIAYEANHAGCGPELTRNFLAHSSTVSQGPSRPARSWSNVRNQRGRSGRKAWQRDKCHVYCYCCATSQLVMDPLSSHASAANIDGLEITECEFESQSMYTVFACNQAKTVPTKQNMQLHISLFTFLTIFILCLPSLQPISLSGARLICSTLQLVEPAASQKWKLTWTWDVDRDKEQHSFLQHDRYKVLRWLFHFQP
jgi:hypothetical protein